MSIDSNTTITLASADTPTEDDVIYPGAGNDYNVIGGAGADTFQFGLGSDVDRIIDWEDGIDRIELIGDLAFEDLRITEHSSDDGRSVNLFTPDNDRLILFNIGDAAIDANDFLGEDGTDPVDEPPTEDDVIYPGAGNDYNVTGGAGADTFQFGLGSDVDRIIDWEDGIDRIELIGDLAFEDLRITEHSSDDGRSVNLFTPDNDRLILFNIGDAVIDANDFLGEDGTETPIVPDGPAPVGGVYLPVLASGQSLIFGTASTSITEGPVAGGWVVDWEDLGNDAEGPHVSPLQGQETHGLVAYEHETREIEGAGLITAIQDNTNDLDVVFGNVAVGGRSLEELSSGVILENTLLQIDAMIDEILSIGALTDQFIFRWQQGQSDTNTDVDLYKSTFLDFVDLLDARVDAAAGFDMDFHVVITQARSYGQGHPSTAQFELAAEYDHISISGFEAEFQSNNPASETDSTHINGQGQYDKGYQAGEHIAELLSTGEEPTMIQVSEVIANGTALIVNFSGVEGALRIGDFYEAENAEPPSLDTFGAGLFTLEGHRSRMPDIIGAEIVDADTVMFILSQELSEPALFATAREHQDLTHGSWLADDNGMIPFQYFEIESIPDQDIGLFD